MGATWASPTYLYPVKLEVALPLATHECIGLVGVVEPIVLAHTVPTPLGGLCKESESSQRKGLEVGGGGTRGKQVRVSSSASGRHSSLHRVEALSMA